MGTTASKMNQTIFSKYSTDKQGRKTLISLDTLSITHKNRVQNKTEYQPFRIIENFIVIWLDSTISELNEDIQYTIVQLRNIFNFVETSSDPEKCIHFMNEIRDEKIFLIVSGNLGRSILPFIENMTQIESIYIFCRQRSQHELWAKQYRKIKGVFIKIERICLKLKQDIRQCEFDLTQINIISNELVDQSFAFSLLFKEILLELEYNDETKKEFIDFCRQQYANIDRELAIINEFEEKYDQSSSSSIWWYTRECFIYLMLNKAIRTDDLELIMRMGYFIRNLNRQIEELYTQSNYKHSSIVYRGQAVPNDVFRKLKKSQGCFLSFNNFLLATMIKDIALTYAHQAKENSDLVAILFRMEIHPSISSIPFVSLDDISYESNDKKEILFSLQTIFYIDSIEQIEDRLWQVNLILTSENDQHLEHFIESIRNRIEDSIGLDQLEKVTSLSTEKTSDKGDEQLAIHYHHILGHIHDDDDDNSDD